MIVTVTLERAGTGNRGDRWRATHAGIVLVDSSRDPEHDACRALFAMGVVGQMETWHAGADFPSMRLDIVRGVRRTVIENQRCGPKFGRWQPYDRTHCLGTVVAESASEQGAASRVMGLVT
jgi:hypothetical protein